MKQTLIEIAFEFLSAQKEPVSFEQIWDYVKANSGLSDEAINRKAGQFYTNLMLDGRFAKLDNNLWDLKSRHVYDDVHADIDDYYSSEIDTANDDKEEAAEEKEYNDVFDLENKSDDDSSGDDEDEESSENEEESY